MRIKHEWMFLLLFLVFDLLLRKKDFTLISQFQNASCRPQAKTLPANIFQGGLLLITQCKIGCHYSNSVSNNRCKPQAFSFLNTEVYWFNSMTCLLVLRTLLKVSSLAPRPIGESLLLGNLCLVLKRYRACSHKQRVCFIF